MPTFVESVMGVPNAAGEISEVMETDAVPQIRFEFRPPAFATDGNSLHIDRSVEALRANLRRSPPDTSKERIHSAPGVVDYGSEARNRRRGG